MKPRYLLLTLLLSTAGASADEVVFYRCTDPSGGLTMQNMPCPKGDKQEKKVMQSVNTVPMGATPPPSPAAATAPATSLAPPVANPPAPAADPGILADGPSPESESEGEAAAIADADRLPPPVLFHCITYDKDSYITEDEEPKSRCVALRTVGLDGDPQGGAGEACEMMRDTCARVADGALCDAWKKRLGETEVAWRFARPGNERKNKEEFDRTRKIWEQTACSK